MGIAMTLWCDTRSSIITHIANLRHISRVLTIRFDVREPGADGVVNEDEVAQLQLEARIINQ